MCIRDRGTAGIINIILKDDRKPGYYGSVKVGADTDGGYQASGNINYSSSKVDAYANLNYRNREFKGGGITSRLNTTDNSFLDQTNDSKRQHNNWFGRFGATWHITKSDDLEMCIRDRILDWFLPEMKKLFLMRLSGI